MMPRSRIIIFVGALGIIAVFLAVIVAFSVARHEHESGSAALHPSPSQASPSVSSATPFGDNAFAPEESEPSSSAFFSSGANGQSSSGISIGSAPTTEESAKTLDDVARIVASATMPTVSQETASATVPSLALPDVPDDQIAIDPKGAATPMEFLSYFNGHYKDVVFDAQRFDGVLKDKNGVILFAPNLIDKAVADDNFGEVRDSLLVQKDFATAEINFLKSIKVTGQAIAVDKTAIGLEELDVQLIDDAVDVASGALSRTSLLSFYGQFNATALNARENLVEQSGVLSLGVPQSSGIFSRLSQTLGMTTPAMAQDLSPAASFGGTVLFINPCPCDLGVNVTIGPPTPASVFVPTLFLSTPLFFSYKALSLGAWWLGLDNELTEIPCGQLPACEPTDLGGEIIMAGTSPPVP